MENQSKIGKKEPEEKEEDVELTHRPENQT